jgi:hypothetical protein
VNSFTTVTEFIIIFCHVSSQLTKSKGRDIMCRFAKCFEVTKAFSCFKTLGTLALYVSTWAHLFPEPQHTFKPASDAMSRQSSQTVNRGMTTLNDPHSGCTYVPSPLPAAHTVRLLPINRQDIKKREREKGGGL